MTLIIMRMCIICICAYAKKSAPTANKREQGGLILRVEQVSSTALQLPAKAFQRVNRDVLEALLNSIDRRLIDANLSGKRGLGHLAACRSNIIG